VVLQRDFAMELEPTRAEFEAMILSQGQDSLGSVLSLKFVV